MSDFGGPPLSPEGQARLEKYGSTLDDANVKHVVERIEDYPEIIAAVSRLSMRLLTEIMDRDDDAALDSTGNPDSHEWAGPER